MLLKLSVPIVVSVFTVLVSNLI